MSVPAGVRHVTSTAYVTYGCRCDECSGWQRERMARYHETRRAEQGSARIARQEHESSPPDYEPEDWDDDRATTGTQTTTNVATTALIPTQAHAEATHTTQSPVAEAQPQPNGAERQFSEITTVDSRRALPRLSCRP